jgi:uncharacterized protein with PIN domain
VRIPGFGEIEGIPALLAEEQRQQMAAAQAEQQRLIALSAARHAETHGKLDRLLGRHDDLFRRLDRIEELLIALVSEDDDDYATRPVITGG